MSRRSYLLRLPDGYDELECINTTGTAAFAVAYDSTPNTRGFSVTFRKTESPTSAGAFCGCARSGYAAFALRIATNGVVSYMYIPQGSTSYAYKSTKYTNGNYLTTSYINETLTYCDGTTETAPAMETHATTFSYFGIGGYYGTKLNANNRGMTISFHHVQLFNGTTAVIDLIPARRRSDSKIGMYDIINNVFYSSTTSTEFTTN